MPSFYEFFAGGGMARAGLGSNWHCLFANDFSDKKAKCYRQNWGDSDLFVEDINKITTNLLPGEADLAWASFPCQDLSLAGNYIGIGHWASKDQTRSGTFWPFWKLMRSMLEEERGPKLIILENVYGAITSNEGRDFSAICSAFSGSEYRFGAMVIDAKHFLPHSRPRLFVVGVRSDLGIPMDLIAEGPVMPWHPEALVNGQDQLSVEAKKRWIWWNLPIPTHHGVRFADIIEENPEGVAWNTPSETRYLLSLMNEVNLAKVEQARVAGRRMVGGIYRRTREDAHGMKRQRAEVRFDDLAGCLRTPTGGSSRQTLIIVDGEQIRTRLLSPREAARLMGLPESYILPTKYNDAYHLAGDGVAVPVVRHLAANIFEPVLRANQRMVDIAVGE
ncbi:DNA cytosine methyltransferase [Citrifermentans bremense]|uniref:DNA cytosine methyltransferase n=1 Tax=Citrifermentans bremense TaxID=60035 RepID=UPI0004792FA4|nr:DNA (cytosine-5-)-methyltransferase [Citrifermentans bremense]